MIMVMLASPLTGLLYQQLNSVRHLVTSILLIASLLRTRPVTSKWGCVCTETKTAICCVGTC